MLVRKLNDSFLIHYSDRQQIAIIDVMVERRCYRKRYPRPTFGKENVMQIDVINSTIQRLSKEAKYFDKSIIPDMSNVEPTLDGNCNFALSVKNDAEVYINESVKFCGAHVKINASGRGVVLIGKGAVLKNCNFHMEGEGAIISIGENCVISNVTIIAKRKNSVVVIGKGTTWESGSALNGHGKIISIGSDCMFSNGVIMRTSDGHGIFSADSKERLNLDMDVIIGNHVWLGNSSRVNKGAVVGSGAVIGQTSIVSNNIDENCIYAGVPAKKLKEGIVWSRSDSYEKIPVEYRI